MEYVLIAIGGAVGSVARFTCTRLLGQWSPDATHGTLLVNLLGSFLLGMLFELCANRHVFGVEARLPLGVGLMGGFTTYSSFSVETMLLFQRGAAFRAISHVLVMVLVCLVASAAGLSLGRTLSVEPN